MSSVAVIAHSGKSLDGGLPALRRALEKNGIGDPLWHEVAKSRQAPKQVRSALEQGADLIFVWGGDGMVQRCVDVVAGSDATMAIVPAGTANLFASNLGIPKHIDAAVEVGLNGHRRKLDVGRMNGEMFAVMAGVGFDARVIRDATPRMKHALGRSAYVWAGAKNLRAKPFEALTHIQRCKIGRYNKHINITAVSRLTTGVGAIQNGLFNMNAQLFQKYAVARYDGCNLGSWRTHAISSLVFSRYSRAIASGYWDIICARSSG